MGKLYTKYALQGENILAMFENGTVYSPAGTLGTGHQVLMYYDGNRIYRSVTSPFGDGFPNVLARCNEFGRIESEDGIRLGYCENGEVKDGSGSIVAYYEGDMFGAAAAACAVIFHLSDLRNPSHTDSNVADSDHFNRSMSDGISENTNDFSVASMISSILGIVLLAVRKLIKTIPIWGPYIFTFLLSALVVAPGLPIIFLLPILLYFILHMVLLIKCRKREGKWKYRPALISLLVYVATIFLLGIPAIIYQIIWLVREQKGRENGGATE